LRKAQLHAAKNSLARRRAALKDVVQAAFLA